MTCPHSFQKIDEINNRYLIWQISADKVIAKGLLSLDGKELLPPVYYDIQPHSPGKWNVKKQEDQEYELYRL